MLYKSLIKRINKYKSYRKLKAKKKFRRHLLRNTLNSHFPDLTVRHGPFKGMKYPHGVSVGSALVPKLIGSYEAELHQIIEEVCENTYSHIIDVGCAEGYYAIGLAMKLPNAYIHAYDTNPKAIACCIEMAEVNNIDSGRISIGGFCNTNTLFNFEFSGKALIISDCEGYEKSLFTPELATHLKEHDLIIETHDLIDIEISTYLFSVFSKTHDIEIIYSIDDIQKAKLYNYTETNDFDLKSKHILFAEGRGSIMEWFYIKSKSNL